GLRDADALVLGYTNAGGDYDTLNLSKTQLEALGAHPIQVSTPYGTMALNGYSQASDGTITVSYPYVLVNAPKVDDLYTQDAFTETATDVDGDVNARDLNISIWDDKPHAENDANSIEEDGTSVTGNVLSDDPADGASTGDQADTQGADGARVSEISSDATAEHGSVPSDGSV